MKKVPYMLSLMLDARFKTLHLVFSLIGHEQRKATIFGPKVGKFTQVQWFSEVA
jgi:hypothetical protein